MRQGGGGQPPPYFMVIKLYHPVHGTKIAISEAEAEADEREGWSRDPEPVNELAPKRRRIQGAVARC